MTRRGVQLNTEFRYLDPNYTGEAMVEVLPSDRLSDGKERHAYFLRHSHVLPYGWSGALSVQRVSDDTYFTDLSTKDRVDLSGAAPGRCHSRPRRHLGRLGIYGFSALVQRWQTLPVDPLAPVTPPYNREPRLTFVAARPDCSIRTSISRASSWASHHPSRVTGGRLMVYPSLSMPMQTSYAYFTPKLGRKLYLLQYRLEQRRLRTETRTLPIAPPTAA